MEVADGIDHWPSILLLIHLAYLVLLQFGCLDNGFNVVLELYVDYDFKDSKVSVFTCHCMTWICLLPS